MALRKTLTSGLSALGLMLLFSAFVFAQEPPISTGAQQDEQRQQQGREGRRRGGRGGRGFGLRGLRELNLSDAQREQARAILARFAQTIRPQREQLMELREQRRAGQASANLEERARGLREQIHESEMAMRAELLSILTPEQRTRFEEIERERKSRRDGMRRRRESAQPEIE